MIYPMRGFRSDTQLPLAGLSELEISGNSTFAPMKYQVAYGPTVNKSCEN